MRAEFPFISVERPKPPRPERVQTQACTWHSAQWQGGEGAEHYRPSRVLDQPSNVFKITHFTENYISLFRNRQKTSSLLWPSLPRICWLCRVPVSPVRGVCIVIIIKSSCILWLRLFSYSGILCKGRKSCIQPEQLEKRTLVKANPMI